MLRPLKSYHLMHDVAATNGECAPTLMARSVHRVINGFVDHARYVAVARSAAKSLSVGETSRRLRLYAQMDANPIAELLLSVQPREERQHRWNAFNRLANLGVRTLIEQTDRQPISIARTQQTDEADLPFRARLSAQCIELLSSPSSGQAQADRPDRLHTVALRLGLAGTPVAELVERLYDEPTIKLDECARQLGCGPRTLQRDLRRQQLNFGLVQQAVRLTIAGFRLRHFDEPITMTAQAAGFFDSAHLNHAWRASCDITPSVYRALNAAG